MPHKYTISTCRSLGGEKEEAKAPPKEVLEVFTPVENKTYPNRKLYCAAVYHHFLHFKVNT